MKRHRDHSSAYNQMKKANLERRHRVRFQVCDIPENTKLWRQRNDGGCQGLRGGGWTGKAQGFRAVKLLV